MNFLDVQLVHAPHHVRILEREVHVVGEMHARDDGDLVAGDGQLLRQARRHEIGVGVQDHDALADGLLALEHLFRRELIGLARHPRPEWGHGVRQFVPSVFHDEPVAMTIFSAP